MKKRSLMFDTNLIYFILIACFVAVRICTSIFSISSALGNILNILLQIVIMFGIPFVLYQVFRKKDTKTMFEDFRFQKTSLGAIICSILIGILVFIINIAVASFFNIIISAIGYDPSFGMTSSSSSPITFTTFIANVFMTAILPGFCEEFAHRGLLLRGYKGFGGKKAIIISGIMFGLMHLNIEQCFYASVIGIFLGFLALMTDNIIPCMIIHFMNNFLSVYLSYASSNNLFGGNFTNVITDFLSSQSALLALFIIFLALIAAVCLLVFLVALLIKQTKIRQLSTTIDSYVKKQMHDSLVDEEFSNNPQKPLILPISPFGEFHISPTGETSTNIIVYDKPSFKDKLFMYATLIIGILVNLSTLIWGML